MKRTSKQIRKAFLLSFVLLILTGFVLRPWGVRFNYEPPVMAQIIPGPAIEGTVFAVTNGNNLISFNQFTPSALMTGPTAITGLQAAELVMGIDFRPRTGLLFAVTNQSRVYTINTSTAAATVVGAAPFTPAVNGTSFGFDFNPVPDRIRFVTDADQDLRLNPNDGTVAGTDGTLAFNSTAPADPNSGTNPNVVGSAYTNNFSGATTTTLFGIDSNLDILVTQGSPGGAPVSPNTGTLFTVGPLGVNTTPDVGFDIVNRTGVALASLTPMGGTTSNLYTINLTTGAATLIGPIGTAETVRDISAVIRVETIFALTTTNGLLSFSSGAPGTPSAIAPITGLAAGETLLGMDFRPANGLLYAVSNQSNVYIINTATAVATLVSATPFTPGVSGANFGVDFNPVPDRIRFVSDTDQDLRLNPNNGAVAGVDGTLAFNTGDPNQGANPNIVAAAYTSNFAGATATTLYEIDSTLNALVTQGSVGGAPIGPNTGTLLTVGMLGVTLSDSETGFDIAPFTDAAFASLTLAGVSTLTTINLTSGAATTIGAIGGGQPIRDIAVVPIVEMIFAATNSNKLISFVATQPGVIQSTTQIAGLASETVLGLDFRPANGTLFAIGSSSTIYTVNPVTGAATPVGPSPTNPQLNGSAYGFDFNPVPDRIRITSNATHNLRFVPDTGLSAPGPGAGDGPLTYAQADPQVGTVPRITASAYNNNFAGATSTTLYGMDTNSDMLVRQGSPGGTPVSPNTGQLFTVGSLGVDAGENNGFDIANVTNNAFAALTVGGVTGLYSVNLATGAVTLIGSIGGGEVIRGISVLNNVTPSMLAPTMAVVNSASFFGGAIAPGSLASVFGKFQTDGGTLTVAPGLPLQTTLGGVSVTLGGQPARLLMASNFQINVALPGTVPDGPIPLMITNSGGSVIGGRINVVRSSPGVFALNSTGAGTIAAVWTKDGVTYRPVVNPNGTESPIPASTPGSPTFLVMFTTGLINTPGLIPNDPRVITVTMNGVSAPLSFAGAAPGLDSVEQMNVVVPQSMSGKVTLRVSAAGRTSNAVTFTAQQ
ncbi:MAG TPA: DUF4394 domain-containing protein [Blastocatellia bacterium]|nr:DUF4394 domain-containing protein [Blastocatellia bacterium]